MKDKIEIVQLLRGIAALLVCFFHMKGILTINGLKLGYILFGSGSIGVPFFFMISGFIMVMTTKNSMPTLGYVGQFYLKRALRIIPVYYLLTFILIFGLGHGDVYFTKLLGRLISGLLFIPTYQNHIGPSYGMPPLEVGWSLNFEIFFYFLLGISMLAGKYRWYLLGSLIFMLVFVLPLLTKGYVLHSLSGWYGYSTAYLSLMTSPIILFFLVGVVIGVIYLKQEPKFSLNLLNRLVLAGLVLFILAYTGVDYFVGSYWHNLVVFGFIFLVLMLRNRVKPFRIPKILVLIGDMSYSLYLVHPVVLMLLPKLLKGIGALSFAYTPWYFLLVLPVIFLLSWCSYYVLEQKLCGWMSAKLLPKRQKLAVAVALNQH